MIKKLKFVLPQESYFDPRRIFFALLGGFLYAVTIKYFIVPTEIILIGTEGIAISLSYFFDSKILFSILFVIFHSLLLVFAFCKISRRFAFHTALLVLFVVLFVNFLPEMKFADPDPKNERILLVIFAGIISGLSKAVAMRNGVSTGDEDVVCTYIAQKYRKQVGSIAMWAAVVPILIGLSLTLIETRGNLEKVGNQLMYTVIYVFMNGQTLNALYRKYRLCNISVVTTQPENVAAAISQFSERRSYTTWKAIGGYTKSESNIFYVVLQYDDIRKFNLLMKQADPNAFITYHELDGLVGNFHIDPIS